MDNAEIINPLFRILVVDDHEPWRREVCLMLQKQAELQVVGEASDGLEAVQKAEELQPDLISLDIRLPGLNGLAAASRIRQVAPATKILFLSQESDRDVIRTALSGGAQGYVLKTDTQCEFLSAVAGILGGDDFVSRSLKWNDSGDTEET